MSDYNGWSNWETWNLSNWLSNDEATYRRWQETARILEPEGLVRELQEDFESYLDDMPNGWHRDVLAQALSRVNWEEVADSIRTED